jgi:hypothetical protein
MVSTRSKTLTVTAFEQTPARPCGNGGPLGCLDERYHGQSFSMPTHHLPRHYVFEWGNLHVKQGVADVYHWFGAKCRSFEWYAQEISGDLVTCWRSQKRSGKRSEEVAV